MDVVSARPIISNMQTLLEWQDHLGSVTGSYLALTKKTVADSETQGPQPCIHLSYAERDAVYVHRVKEG